MDDRNLPSPNQLTLKVGAKVILDQFGKAILHADTVSAKSQFSFEEDTNVAWDDIVGLYDAKRLLREAIELAKDYRGLYESYGKKPIRGVDLESVYRYMERITVVDSELARQIQHEVTIARLRRLEAAREARGEKREDALPELVRAKRDVRKPRGKPPGENTGT